MVTNQPDYILYKPAPLQVEGPQAQTAAGGQKLYPMTHGVWQREALDTLDMYGPDAGRFSSVSKATGAGPAATLADPRELHATLGLGPDDPAFSLVPHKDDFRFFATDTLPFVRHRPGLYTPTLAPIAPAAPTAVRPRDISDLTGGDLFDPSKVEFKADQFPDRLIYLDGGLYPAGSKNDPAVQKAHENAPNYRKMDGKPIHGVGQPTVQGYHDVLDHLGAKGKPAVWTNTRAEAVMYIEGKPYNLRQLSGFENVDLKAGATGEQVEALEEQLKQKLLARGSIEVSEEVPVLGPDGKPEKDEKGRMRTTRETRTVALTPDSCKTTKDVIQGLQDEGYKVEYRRIPISDEKSPTPANLDDLRDFMSEMKAKHPGEDIQYVFNCHQGKGRTTTAMVSAGILLDGKSSPMKIPLIGEVFGDDPKARAERNIDKNFHLQNLREVVDEYKKNAADAGARADKLREQAAKESDPTRRAELEAKAAGADAERARTDDKAREFTKRYSMMIKYSEYVCKYGPDASTPTFEDWMGEATQTRDLNRTWAMLNTQLGLAPAGTQPETAFA